VAVPLGDRVEQRVPMSRLRQRVAERLLQSQSQNAILTTFNEVNMKPIMDLRAKYKEKFEKQYGVKLGFMSFFVKAAVAALKKFPAVNASIDGNDIVYHGYFDIGIAVGSPRGLVVPILRNVDQMSIADIELAIVDYANKAKSGKIAIEDLTGGTFSITNGGTFGSMMSTPKSCLTSTGRPTQTRPKMMVQRTRRRVEVPFLMRHRMNMVHKSGSSFGMIGSIRSFCRLYTKGFSTPSTWRTSCRPDSRRT